MGEQPGDREDLAGRPFVGPAGAVFDRALAAAGIDRASIYVTNAVKHFKNEPRGKRRLHKKPNAAEIEQCRWWLVKETALLAPRLTVALGATALRSLLGRDETLSRSRGTILASPFAGPVFVTITLPCCCACPIRTGTGSSRPSSATWTRFAVRRIVADGAAERCIQKERGP